MTSARNLLTASLNSDGVLAVHRVRGTRHDLDPGVAEDLAGPADGGRAEHAVPLAGQQQQRERRGVEFGERGAVTAQIAQVGHFGGVERPHLLEQERQIQTAVKELRREQPVQYRAV